MQAEASAAEGAASRAHFIALDSLRGIAALAVVLYHVRWTHPLYGWGVIRNGYLAVDFFFVLSGFVIAYSYGARLNRPAALRRFAWLRFWRLYPVHLAVLLLLLGAALSRAAAAWLAAAPLVRPPFGGTDSLYSLLCNFLLVQGFNFKPLGWNIPSWSISVEFYVYFAFALVVFTIGFRRAAFWVFGAIALVAALLLAGRAGHGLERLTSDFGMLRALAGFSLGILTFAAWRRVRTLSMTIWRLRWLSSLAMIAAAAYLWFNVPSRADLAIYPVSAAMVLAVAALPPAGLVQLLLTRPAEWLGRISYSVYMTHFPVLVVAMVAFKRAVPGLVLGHDGAFLVVSPMVGLTALLIALAAVLAVADLSYRWIERPARDWSRAVLARRRARAVIAVPELARPGGQIV
jgi:peptidoglycan/LPS O-acetylase OafA/YrhL